MFVEGDGFDQAGCDHGYADVGVAFCIDDPEYFVYDGLFYGFFVDLVIKMEVFVDVFEAEAGDVYSAPGGEGRVAVFAEHVAMDVFGVDVVAVGQASAQAVCFKHGAGADDLFARVVELGRYVVRCDVERIGDHDDDGLFRVFYDFIHDAAHDLAVCLSEYQAVRRFTGLDAGAGRDDDGAGVFAVAVVAFVNVDVGAVEAGGHIAGIESFTDTLVFVDIDESDFGCELEIKQLGENC